MNVTQTLKDYLERETYRSLNDISILEIDELLKLLLTGNNEIEMSAIEKNEIVDKFNSQGMDMILGMFFSDGEKYFYQLDSGFRIFIMRSQPKHLLVIPKNQASVFLRMMEMGFKMDVEVKNDCSLPVDQYRCPHCGHDFSTHLGGYLYSCNSCKNNFYTS